MVLLVDFLPKWMNGRVFIYMIRPFLIPPSQFSFLLLFISRLSLSLSLSHSGGQSRWCCFSSSIYRSRSLGYFGQFSVSFCFDE